MNILNEVSLSAFADELVKIGSIDEMEKEAILGRLLSRGLSPKMLAAARMGEHEVAQVAGKGGLGALRGPMGGVGATLRHQGGLARQGLQRATAGSNVAAGRIGI